MAIYTETIQLKDNVSGPAEKASKSVGSLSDKVGGMQAELAELTGGLSLVAEAVLGAVVAFGALTVAGAAFAIKASQEKQAALALWDALGEGVVTGEQIDDMLDGLREKTGISKDALGSYTQEFLRLGITGTEALEGLTVAAASAEAIVKGGGQAFSALFGKINAAAESGQKLTIPFKKLQSQLVAVGLNISDVAKQMGITEGALTSGLKAGTIDAKKFGDAVQDAVTKKGAGPLQNMANSVENLGKLIKEYIGDIFEDLGPSIAPFMAQVRELFGIFDSKTKPSGQALKQGIEGFFKRVFDLATKVVPMVKHFLENMIIYGLKAYIALKPVINWFKSLADNQTVIAVMSSLVDGLKTALVAIGVALAVVIGAFVILTGIGIAVGASIWALAGIISSFVADSIKSLVDWVAGAYQTASDFVSGLVQGITDGAGKVIGAVTGIADGAVNAFKGALGIHSPSAVMASLGGFTSQGFAEGMESKAPDVHAAGQSVSGNAVAGASGGSAAAPSSGGGSTVTVTVEPGAISINGGSAQSVSELTEQAVSLIFERIALSQGL